jgi:ribosomal protein L19
MQKLTSVLLKKKLDLLFFTTKRPYLYNRQYRLTGKILCVLFNKYSTIFEVSDYVKTSKKQRSNVTDVQVKDIFQYNFIGICIAHKKDSFMLNTSYLIRNTFDKVPYELMVNLYSPIIDEICVYVLIEKLIRITHSKYYYLRKKPAPMSTIFFDYVVDMFEHDIMEEVDPIIKKMRELFYDAIT